MIAGDVLAAVEDGSGGRQEELGQQIEHRGLAGAIGADQPMNAALPDFEADLVHGHETAELPGKLPGFEDGLVLHLALFGLAGGFFWSSGRQVTASMAVAHRQSFRLRNSRRMILPVLVCGSAST